MAITSLVLGILWFWGLGSLVAVILGHLARAQIKRIINEGYGKYDRMTMEHGLAGPEYAEGAAAFKERRSPAWVPEDLRKEGRL